MDVEKNLKEKFTTALDVCVNQIRQNLPEFTEYFQDAASTNNFYKQIENTYWTTGFWTGQIWLAYEYSGDRVFKEAALLQVESFYHRIRNKIEVDHHDMGFLYSLSCVAGYKLTGNLIAKEAALLAADQLLARYHPKGEFIQAWGSMKEPENYRLIIDCLLNVPLLYWATKETGDPKYTEAGIKHTRTALANVIRKDGSTQHTFYFDPKSGKPTYGETCQGYSNDSSWARGQAWGVYGIALSYRYTKDPKYIPLFQIVVDYYLKRLPEDLVPYWDLYFTKGNDQPRDSSSAAIVVCGILEMSQYLEADLSKKYIEVAKKIMVSLIDHYSVKSFATSNGLLLHGTYSNRSPYNTCNHCGVDECTSWGDYFYMEALTRLVKEWEVYW